MRLPRLTTRRLMALVEVAGIGFGVGVEGWRRRSYAIGRASHHEWEADTNSREADNFDKMARHRSRLAVFYTRLAAQRAEEGDAKDAARLREIAQEEARVEREFRDAGRFSHSLAEYHARLYLKYRLAIDVPWSPVPPDPPMPE